MTDRDDLIDETEGESFAEMLEQSLESQGGRLVPGQKVTARVLKVSSEWLFIDTGHKGEGVVDVKEFLDPDGNPTVQEGDSISVYFLSSSRGEMRFTTRIGGGAQGNAQLEEAWQAGVPVEGVVEKEIKGGYEVKLAGTTRAFCPFSQMSLRRIENPESLIGTRLAFRITDYTERGRNIVVSRRVLLEEEQRRLREEAQAALSEGMTV
ncbi:30S ribosomal protein S1, partial [bacterium]